MPKMSKKAVKVEQEPDSPLSVGNDEIKEDLQPIKKVKKPPTKPSLWMQTLQKHGFMVKGGAFKPCPKKGSPEYEAVRKDFDEQKQSAAK